MKRASAEKPEALVTRRWRRLEVLVKTLRGRLLKPFR